MSNDCPLEAGSSVWLYFRDSGGDSQDLFSQKARVLEYCQTNQLKIDRIFEDGARSGGSITNRFEFNELIRLANLSKKPLVKGIICWDMSRFSRSMDDGPYYRRMLEMLGYRFIFVSVYIPEGITGKIVQSSYDIANALLLDRISTDSKRGLQLLIDLGIKTGVPYWTGRAPRCFLSQQHPTGRILNDGSTHTAQIITPDATLWPVGQLAFQMRAARHTYEEIAQATGLWNEVYRQRKNHIANPMTGKSLASRVASFFGQTIYKGILTRKEQEYPGYIEAMVSPELWEAANAYRYERGQSFTSVPHPKSGRGDYLLSGLLRCGYCNEKLYGVHSVDTVKGKVYDKRYYKCNTLNYDKDRCESKRISIKKIEPLIVADVLSFLDYDFINTVLQGVRETWGKDSVMETDIVTLEREAVDLRVRIKNLREQIERGDNQAWQWYREREEQLKQVNGKLDALRSKKLPQLPYIGPEVVEAVVGKLAGMIGGEVLRERQLVLQSVINKIDVYRDRAVIFYKMPEGLLDVYYSPRWDSVINVQHTIEI